MENKTKRSWVILKAVKGYKNITVGKEYEVCNINNEEFLVMYGDNNEIIKVPANVFESEIENEDIIDFDLDAVLEYTIKENEIENEKENEIKNNEREDINMAKSLKEMALEKLNYRKIAETLYEELEGEISEEVAARIDEYDIVNFIKNNNKSDYLSIAKEVVLDEILEDIDDISSDVEDEFKEIVKENINI